MIQLAVAAYAAWVLERTKEALKEAGATSEETAKTPKKHQQSFEGTNGNCRKTEEKIT